MAEEDSWEREVNLKNAKEAVKKYEREYGKEGRRMEEEKEEEREMPGMFMAKTLYGWDNGKFDREYLKKLERNWRRWKGAKFF